MGVISFFKNKIYDSRLQKAGELLEKGRKEEALQAYKNLLGKQIEAVGILARIYYEDCRKCRPAKQVEYLRMIAGLPAQNGQYLVWDRTGYDDTLTKTVLYLFSDAKRYLAYDGFKDAYTILNELRVLQLASPEMISCYMDACQGCVQNKEVIDLNGLKDEINKQGGALAVFTAFDRFIPYIKEYSHDYLKYSSWYILNSGCEHNEAVEKFARCWSFVTSGDVEKTSYLKGLFDSSEIGLARELFRHITSHSDRYLINKDVHEILIKWASSLASFDECLWSLSQLHIVGVNVQAQYEERIHSGIGKIDLNERRDILNKALALFPDSNGLLNDKLSYVKNLAKAKQYSVALEICDELSGRHNHASLTKAKVYVCIAGEERDMDKKMEALSLAWNLINTEEISKNECKWVLSIINDISLDAAQSYHQNGNKSKAYEIVRNAKTIRAAMLLASFLSKDEIDVASDDKIQYYRNSIEELKATNVKEVLESDDYVGMWVSLSDLIIHTCSATDHGSAISLLKNLVEELDNEGKTINAPLRYSASIEKAKKEQIKRMYLLAREYEKSGQIEQAAKLYSDTKKVEGKTSPTLADFRYVICKLKTGDNNVSVQKGVKIESLLAKAPSAFEEERNEVAYRYALQLLRAGQVDRSLNIINQYLPQESTLKQACEQQYTICGLKRLDDFNSRLELIRTRQLSSDDAIRMVNHMLEFADEVKYVINIGRQTLSKYRKSIKNYAILKLFDEERYDVAFDKLKKEYSNFLEDLTSLRNIAIVCLNMAESGMINDDNYQEVISIWLTAIYQERLFIKSLDYTSWDDQFTFSLAAAYGHFNADTIGDLPDNVNFDEPDGSMTNVAIKDVQQSLLNRFEAAINENNRYLQFFNEQKDAMDDLVELNLDEKCRIVAPFFAEKSQDIFSEIESAFETDRINHYSNYEDVLATGYKFGLTKDEYGEYHRASGYYDECIRVVEELDTNRKVAAAYHTDKIELIKAFPNKWDSLIAFVKGKVASLGSSTRVVFDIDFYSFLKVCSSLNDESISFPFANYVLRHVVGEVNGHRMSKVMAAEYILQVYLLDPSNTRTQDNLITLFEMLAREEDGDSQNAVSDILNKVYGRDIAFYRKLDQEYKQVKIDRDLSEIIDRVNNDLMKRSDALKRVHQLYITYPENERLCVNLATLSDLCILEYVIGQGAERNDVERILNQIIANKSQAFKRQSSIFKKSYESIWDQIPYETQRLLSNNPMYMQLSVLYGKTLNDKGLALKKGLDLLKELGDFDGNGLGSLFRDRDPRLSLR